MIPRLLCLVVSLALAGCATSPSKVITQRVEVPVAVPCVKRSQIPVKPASKFAPLPKAAPVDEQVRALLVDREAGKIYGNKTRALLEACVITDATSSADLAPSPVKP